MENTGTKVTLAKQDMEFLRGLLIEEFKDNTCIARKDGKRGGYISNCYMTTLIDKLGNGLGFEKDYWKNNIMPKYYDKTQK